MQVVLPRPQTSFTLGRAAAISSCAFAGVVNNVEFTSSLAPNGKIWPVQSTAPAVSHVLGDGGNLENLGLNTMLRRGVRKVSPRVLHA